MLAAVLISSHILVKWSVLIFTTNPSIGASYILPYDPSLMGSP
jgi:hypothetical protein